MIPDSNKMTLTDAAKMLNISRRYIYKHVADTGKLLGEKARGRWYVYKDDIKKIEKVIK